MLRQFPAIQSARRAGTLSINVTDGENPTAETRIASAQLSSLIPRAKRKRGTHYSIDNLAVLVLDIETAMSVALSKKARVRLLARFLDGYTDTEIGLMEGVSDEAVRSMNKRSCQTIAAWLESPKSPQVTASYQYEEFTHRRSYNGPPHFVPKQR